MLEVHLFGRFRVLSNGQELKGIDARKEQELFCYLLLQRDAIISREVLASMLWPDTTTSQSKKYLRKSLWQLHAALKAQTEPTNSRMLRIDPEWIQLNSETDLWLDVAEFEQAFVSVQKISGRELDALQVQTLQDAIELYQKPLLEDWYEDWCLRERDRLQTMYLLLLDKLMDYCIVRRDCESGLFYGLRSLAFERTRESTYRRLMRLHYLAGDRASALYQYERCVASLEEDFGMEPSKQTKALYKAILADQLDESRLIDTPGIVHEEPNLSLLEVFNSLILLQTFVTDLQQQIQQNIQQVAPLLKKNPKNIHPSK